MKSKSIFILLCCYVYSVISLSPFFKKGERAEFYELLDNEMPSVKVFMTKEEFKSLKDSANSVYANTSNEDDAIETESPTSLFDEEDNEVFTNVPNIMYEIKSSLKMYKKMNFKVIYPDKDINKMLPQLQLGEDGYAQYDVEEVFKGYDYDPEHYKKSKIKDYDDLRNALFKSNKDFDLMEITNKLDGLEMAIDVVELYDMIGDITFETWEKKEFYKYNEDLYVEEEEGNNGRNNKKEYAFSFKTKNATMIFELNETKKVFNKITFSVGGNTSRYKPKPIYNLKIKDKMELYGRKQFKLRSDMQDPTYLRSKLTSDIRNRLGMPSISTNYIQLYINDEFMGLYIITDDLDLPWIEKVFNDKKTDSLYKCESLNNFLAYFSYGCINKNEDVKDDSEWVHFLETVEKANSPSDLEDILDIDHFLHEMAMDYLLNALDHYSHNFYMYKKTNGKWTYISYDFDGDFSLLSNNYNMPYSDYFNIYNNKGRLYDVLISKDSTRFNETIKEIVEKVFNPATLYPHIDELREFLEPYVILDKTLGSNGRYPGVLLEPPNYKYFTFEQWKAYTGFNNGKHDTEWTYEYGIKYLILKKYRYVCEMLDMKCDPVYMDENYDISTPDESSSEEEEEEDVEVEIDLPTTTTDDENSSEEEEEEEDTEN